MRHIPESELEIAFVRSSGPGGQNVNKTSTKAQLRWLVSATHVFTPTEINRICSKLANRLTDDGYIAIDISDSRSQLQNKERAIELLQQLVNEALEPEKPRLKTRPPRSAKLKRLESKRKRGDLKQLRKPLNFD